MPEVKHVEVYVGEEGHVVLRQFEGYGDEIMIILSPEQIQTVTEWMADAADTAIASRGLHPGTDDQP